MKTGTQLWISAGILAGAALTGILLFHGLSGGENASELPEIATPAHSISAPEEKPDQASGNKQQTGEIMEILDIPDTAAVPDVERKEITESEEEALPEQEVCQALAVLLEESGYDAQLFSGTQLIVVDSWGSEAELWCFEKRDGFWQEKGSPIHAWLGESGISWEKQEGDGATPAGLYALGPGFGVETPEDVSIEYRAVTEASYWVDDPDSAYYNTWVEGTQQQDWVSAEQLSAFPEEYAFAVVIEYNTDEPVYAAGSAIFLHCGTAPTAGCVAVEREHMLEILSWLQPDSGAEILIY